MQYLFCCLIGKNQNSVQILYKGTCFLFVFQKYGIWWRVWGLVLYVLG